jgi:sec-independent protein translocase protein TatA
MGPIGFNEILIILVIILLLFGAKKIPELMRGVGKGIREFSDAKNSARKDMDEGMREKEITTTANSSGKV